MRERPRQRDGFTLVEMMVSIAIVGILAAIAIPTFIMLVNRSKTAEVPANLNSMFKSAASYYSSERSGVSFAEVAAYCTVDSAGLEPATPTSSKQKFTGGPTFKALGFTISDFVYYSYGLEEKDGASNCDNTVNDPGLYTMYARGNLNADAIQSTFELAVGSDGDNTLYHQHGFYVDNELE